MIYNLFHMGAFAAVLKNKSVVTWRDENVNGGSNKVNAVSIGAVQIYSTANEFTPVLKHMRVVTWSDENAEVTVIR